MIEMIFLQLTDAHQSLFRMSCCQGDGRQPPSTYLIAVAGTENYEKHICSSQVNRRNGAVGVHALVETKCLFHVTEKKSCSTVYHSFLRKISIKDT